MIYSYISKGRPFAHQIFLNYCEINDPFVNLLLDVKDDYLILSGTIEKVTDNSSFTSSFNKSFPVPSDADASKLEVDQDSKEEFLIIKIPKKK